MQHETIIMGLCTDIPVRTLSVHCVTCHGPNILSAVFRIFWCSPLRSTAAFATLHAVCSLLTATNGHRLLSVEALHSVQPLACYILVNYSVTFITLAVACASYTLS